MTAPTRPPRSNLSLSPMPSRPVKMKNPTSAPARPRRTVAKKPIGSRPGISSRPRNPATMPRMIAPIMGSPFRGGWGRRIRRSDGTPSHAVEDFRAITDAIRAEVSDAVIVNYSTGAVGVSVEERVAYLSALRPEVAALNMGSMNYAKYSPRRRDFVFKAVFANPFDEIIALLEAMTAAA